MGKHGLHHHVLVRECQGDRQVDKGKTERCGAIRNDGRECKEIREVKRREKEE